MSEKDPIRLFITHAFKENEEYAKVFEFIESRENFFYVNYSAPDDIPEAGGAEAIQEAIREQIKPVEIVIFPAGIYADNPRLIQFELQVAQAFGRPILLITSHGTDVKLPAEAEGAANETVEWDNRAITDAVRKLARGEDSGSFDLIEFDLDGIETVNLDEIKKHND